MKTSEERRWERVQQQLLAEAQGKAPVRICSQKTLFGIKSAVDEAIEAIVAQHEEELAQQRARDRRADCASLDDGRCGDPSLEP